MDRRRASRVRQELKQTEEARRSQVEVILNSEALVDGSFVTLGRKCGKPTCRCATGEKHFSKFLSRSVEGRTQLTYVPSADEVEVARKAERYKGLRQARAELMKLSARTAALADSLQKELTEPYPPEVSSTPRRKPRSKPKDDGGAER